MVTFPPDELTYPRPDPEAIHTSEPFVMAPRKSAPSNESPNDVGRESTPDGKIDMKARG